MSTAWITSALRPEELAKPMPTGDGLHPMWRLMKPSARSLVTAEVIELPLIPHDETPEAGTQPASA